MQVLHIVGAADSLFHAEDKREGQHHAVVTEAQSHAFLSRGDHQVGLVEEVLQQRIDGVVVVLRAGHQSLPQTPTGVIHTEAVDILVLGKQVFKRQSEFGQTLHIGCDVPQGVGEFITVDLVAQRLRILKQQGYLVAAVQFLMTELVEFLIQRSVGLRLRDFDAVVGDDVIHVVLAGVHLDVDLRIHRLQLLTEVGHREHAAAHGR